MSVNSENTFIRYHSSIINIRVLKVSLMPNFNVICMYVQYYNISGTESKITLAIFSAPFEICRDETEIPIAVI